ncbi:hypothetical protein C0J52_03615 [Blattella germanica]|nr:hypothetical protein C0J52_03615 [Blattella germanica]
MMKHVCGNINRHNCRNWGSENLLEVREVERDSPKQNVWCALMKNKVIRLFLFAENSVTGKNYLDILQHYAVPHGTIFQQDMAPTHFVIQV